MLKKQVIRTKKKKEFVSLLQGLSPERLELIWNIRQFRPDSIYQLAQKINKSQPYVLKELRFLSEKGLITLKKSKENGRWRMKPTVEYHILTFEMELDVEAV